jgi:hypothetical protein
LIMIACFKLFLLQFVGSVNFKARIQLHLWTFIKNRLNARYGHSEASGDQRARNIDQFA